VGDVGALIPAYRAARTVASVVRGALRQLPTVWVVDDGSSDGTAEAASGAGARVLRFPANRGKGAALRAGFAELLRANVAAVVTLDADEQHDPSEIPRLIDCWRESGASLVIGSRQSLEAGMRPVRRFGNRFSRFAISYFAGVPVPDGQSGFRLYDAGLLRTLTLTGSRYELESEVIVRAARRGLRIEHVPIALTRIEGTETSHFRPWADTARICLAVVRTRFERCS
jgi:glycosyltransferase involved in cell wall biosynthesis